MCTGHLLSSAFLMIIPLARGAVPFAQDAKLALKAAKAAKATAKAEAAKAAAAKPKDNSKKEKAKAEAEAKKVCIFSGPRA